MKNTLIKLIAAMIAVIMLTALVACGGNNGSGDNTKQEVTKAGADNPYRDVKYSGYDFRILTSDDEKNYVFCEEQNDSQIDSAVYNANKQIEALYDIKISTIPLTSNMDRDTVVSLTLTDVDTYDMTHMHDCTTATMSLEGYFQNIYDLEPMDPTAEWWPQFTVDSLTLNGKMFLIHNWTSYHPAQATVMIAFNKSLLKDYKDLENPYDLVRGDAWTFDKFIEMSKSVYVDRGEQGVDDEDLFGMTTSGYLYSWMESFGFEFYQKVSPDSAELTLANGSDEKLINFLQKFYDWGAGSNPGVYLHFQGGDNDGLERFAAGNALFTARNLGNMITYIVNSNVDYGFLPFPKLTERDDYKCGCNGNPMAIPTNLTDEDRTATIAEAMAYAGYKYVRPAYVDVLLKNRYSDDDTRDMIDIAFNNRVLSFTYLFSNVTEGGGIQYQVLRKTVGSKNDDFASYFAHQEPKEIATIEKIVAAYEKD